MKVYLDSHATTPLDPRVLKAMLPYLTSEFANPSSAHVLGVRVRETVEQARATIAQFIHAQPHQIYFTSGATESNNTVIKGFVRISRPLYLTSSNIEHPSVLECLRSLARDWDRATFYTPNQVDRFGWLSDFATRFDFCSVHAANNELGNVYDLERLGRMCRSRGAFFHTDATQAIGKTVIDVESQYIDALSFSAHKLVGRTV